MSKSKGSYIHGVYVSAATKDEFKKNKNDLKSEGIKSAYSLQKQKNIAKKALKLERSARREVIKKAYESDKARLNTIGYDVNFFLDQFKKIEDYNEKIKKAIKKGKILKDTPLLSFPISIETGKINLKRLQKELKKLDKTINQIQTTQYNLFYKNVREIYGEEIEKISKQALKGVPLNSIYETFNEDLNLSPLVNYDIGEFEQSARASVWGRAERMQDHFLELLQEIRRLS